jgi:malate synthase
VVHALHYHEVDVAHAQAEARRPPRDRLLEEVLCPPVMAAAELPTAEEVRQELEESCQSILGYVVRWVEQGVGCSKVPDLKGVQLMEDRATLRISSQLLASWLRHGVISDEELDSAMRKMAQVVDEQNAADPVYRPMCAGLDASLAFQAAGRLVREGGELPNGLTEPILHAYRRQAKDRSRRSRL